MFPEELKDKIELTIGRKDTEFTYIIGELLIIKGTNVDCINPNKVIINERKKKLFYYSMANIITKMMHSSYTIYTINVHGIS